MVTDTMAEADLVALAEVLRKVGRGFIQAIGATPQQFERLSEPRLPARGAASCRGGERPHP